ncbi:MAG: GyrI-like domain-containing protein [Bacteroidales bacterium]|nr:GyrI-like domain-containing protein [Bacteroidales bacterium]
MKFVRWFMFILIGLALLILITALFLPKSLNFVAYTEINAPVKKVYYSLSHFTDRQSWDPWLKQDSTVKMEIQLNENVLGSKYSWTSIHSSGGEMVIDTAILNEHLAFSLGFDGMSKKARVWNDFSEIDGKTKLSWGFYQDASYPVGRIFMALIKGRLEKDYRQGLENFKNLVEEKGVKMSYLSEPIVQEMPGFEAIIISGKANLSEMNTLIYKLFGSLLNEIDAQDLTIEGTMFTHFLNYDPNSNISEFEIGVPVSKAGKGNLDLKFKTFPSFMALKVTHTGPYDELPDSYKEIMEYAEKNNIQLTANSWEFYLSDPKTLKDESKWQTLLAFPLIK